MNADKVKEIIKPDRRKFLVAIGVFTALTILTAPINIFYSFQQALLAPLPYYVLSTCTSQTGGCPEVVTGLRVTALSFNILFCYLSSSALTHWRGDWT